ncbi:MAG: Ig-like domain-containing protein [Spirochaetota bacterium]
MKRYYLLPEIALLILLSLFPLFTNCTNRKPLVELAKINPDDVPFIVLVEPAEGTSWIPTNTQLSVLFSHPMDRGSIKDALKIYYEGFKLDGSSMTFEWDSNSRQCKINPQLTFPLNAEITVTIDTTVRSKDGIPMKKPFTWSFLISTNTQTGEPVATPLCPAINKILTLNKSIEIGFDRQMLRSSVGGSISASGESVGVYVNN